MKFCCGGFEGAYCIGNHFGMVKFTSPIFLDGGYELFNISRLAQKTKNKRNDIIFCMTMGYETFRFELSTIIIFCPFCGANLFDFYTDDSYINEIEGETFTIFKKQV